MRLIDANAFYDKMLKMGLLDNQDRDIFLDAIDEQPTAYDVDKVVEELWNLKHEYIIRDMPSGILIDAIKVVKRGGVNEQEK